MSAVRVLIATTAGPVAVQRITEEDPDVNSVICLAGKAVALPVSAAYDAFVRNPTGVIQRNFSHPAFRLDVSDKIDEGYSWQLGVYAAHALKRVHRLAGPSDAAGSVLIATGEVDRDLMLHPVDGVADKIEKLEPKLADLMTEAEGALIAVPAGTEAPWIDAFGANPGVEVIPVANVHDLLQRLGIEATPKTAPPPPAPEPEAPRKRVGGMAVLIALLLLAAMGAAAGGAVYAPEIRDWVASLGNGSEEKPATAPVADPLPDPPKPVETAVATEPTPAPPPPAAPAADPIVEPVADKPSLPESAPPPRKPDAPEVADAPEATEPATDEIAEARTLPRRQPPVEIAVEELRAPPGRSCADVHAGRAQPIRQPARKREGGGYYPSPGRNLCTVEIRATGADPAIHLFGRYERWTQARPGDAPADKVIDLGPRQGSIHWTVDMPQRLSQGALFKVMVFTADREYTPSRRVLRRIGTLAPRGDEARRLVRRLRDQGIRLTRARFRVVAQPALRDRTFQPSNDWRRPPPPNGAFPPPPRN